MPPFQIALAAAPILFAVVAGAFSLFQWLLSVRARSDERDDELLAWGAKVMDAMAELETLCANPASLWPGVEFDRRRLALAASLSSLVDQGRMFFPNVQSRGQQRGDKPEAYRGSRVVILDQVIVGYDVAHLIPQAGPERKARLQQPLRDARREFVSLLQKEVGSSRRSSAAVRQTRPAIKIRLEDLS